MAVSQAGGEAVGERVSARGVGVWVEAVWVVPLSGRLVVDRGNGVPWDRGSEVVGLKLTDLP